MDTNSGHISRVIVLVIDGLGVGAMPDVAEVRPRDVGADTLGHVMAIGAKETNAARPAPGAAPSVLLWEGEDLVIEFLSQVEPSAWDFLFCSRFCFFSMRNGMAGHWILETSLQPSPSGSDCSSRKML